MDWLKSSYSGANGGDCVEIVGGGSVMIRDTVNRDGGTLVVTADACADFTASLK